MANTTTTTPVLLLLAGASTPNYVVKDSKQLRGRYDTAQVQVLVLVLVVLY
jgi:hypothetical protein